MDAKDFEKIRRFIYRNARPLDLYRWQFLFENGSPAQVVQALACYQNEDGGFGHALEPDAWNPNSSPIQTSTAVQLLWEIGFTEKNHPLSWGILQYLDSGADMENGRWQNVVPTNGDFPHAPWWKPDSQSTSHSEFNPTAILAGFGLYFAPRNSALFTKCLAIAKEVATAFFKGADADMHSLLCLQALAGWARKAEVSDTPALAELEEGVLHRAAGLIWEDQDRWNGYACRPSTFMQTPAHPLYGKVRALADKECLFLLETRNEQGVWDIPWRWEGYEKAFAISENWWKADLAIKNTAFLRAFAKPAGEGE